MRGIAEYILAKKTLAELDSCTFADSQMSPVELADDRVYGYLGRPAKPVIANFVSGVLLFNLLGTTYGNPVVDDCSGEIIAISTSQSDSQPLSQRAQRAADVRTLNLQTQTPLARVYEFERSFPEEGIYRPQMPETPRILKLRK